MSLEIGQLSRRFKMGSVLLQDPDPKWTPDQVREAYADSYPSLAACSVGEPEIEGQYVTHEFLPPTAKTKG